MLVLMNVAIVILSAGILILVSAICSGLNVGLMSLEIGDLRRKAKLGDKHAIRALPIRNHVHFYLSGILLTNTAVAASTSIVLTNEFNGIIAGISSTLLLVVFGEITPQAIAVKNAVRAVSFFAPAIIFITYATYPITRVLEVLLDKLIGKSKQTLHTRHELGLLIDDHLKDSRSELDEDEVEIVRNALKLSEKRVSEIMTHIKDVYHLDTGTLVDSGKINELIKENYSRIPIIDHDKRVCKGYLMLRDLVHVDFDEHTYSVEQLRVHTTHTVGSKTALDTLFRKFIEYKKHLLVVEKDERIVGIVTLEDLVEEIIGHEVEDESDVDRITDAKIDE